MLKARINKIECLIFEDSKEGIPTSIAEKYPYRYYLGKGNDGADAPGSIELRAIPDRFGIAFTTTPLLKEGEERRAVRKFKILRKALFV